ncbi:hypothetical protein cypCar_00042047, partial [Cyprinus carpio]
VILRSGPGTFFGLAIHGNYIFWSDWTRRAVLRTNKFTGGDTKVLRADIPHQPMGIIAVAKDTNNCELSPCRVLNGGCGDLCLLTPDGTVNCSCRGERILLDDNRCVCKFCHASLRLSGNMSPSISERCEITWIHSFQHMYISVWLLLRPRVSELFLYHLCYRLE